jgi:thioredoxin reductase
LIAIVEDIAATAAATDFVRSDAMKSPTVDLVVTGDERAAIAAALNAVRLRQRVLIVLGAGDGRAVGRLRRLSRAARSQLTVMTNAEVVCVDGVDGVEAVVVRYMRTGRLCAVNTPAFLSCDPSFPES